MTSNGAPKAKDGDFVRLIVEVTADVSNRTLPAGTSGVVVESYRHPVEGYAVDLKIPDDSLVGGHDYENVILKPEQFEVIPHPCLLRVHAELPVEALMARVARHGGGRHDEAQVDTDTSFVRVVRQGGPDEGAGIPRYSSEFRYELWAEARPGVPLEAHAATIAAVLEGLWADGIAAVALCNYEHLLPDQGGQRWKGE